MSAAEVPKRSDVEKSERPDVQVLAGEDEGDAIQDVQAPEHSKLQASKRSKPGKAIVPRKDGEVRRMTLYLSPDLAKRLKMASVEHETDMSKMAEDAIAAWLNRRGW